MVGKIGAFTVYDLEYFGGDEPAPFLRSVLVETARNRLHEIHLWEILSGGELYPSEILHAGKQPILAVRSYEGNMYYIVDEEYFIISADGVLLLDFEPVMEAAGAVIPADRSTHPGAWEYDFQSMVFQAQTEPNLTGLVCCDGHVEVPFRIEQGRVIAGKATYFPK